MCFFPFFVLGVTRLMGAITDTVLLIIFNELTVDKYDFNDGKDIDEQSVVKN